MKREEGEFIEVEENGRKESGIVLQDNPLGYQCLVFRIGETVLIKGYPFEIVFINRGQKRLTTIPRLDLWKKHLALVEAEKKKEEEAQCQAKETSGSVKTVAQKFGGWFTVMAHSRI